jgi:type II secretory pathway component PulC
MALLLAFEWITFVARPAAALADPMPPAAASDSALPARFVPPPRAEFAVIHERPLFVPDRRPQPDEVAASTPVALPNLVLEGVVLTQGRSYAVLRHGMPPKVETLLEGATVEGWTIKDISAERITLESGASTVEVAVQKPGPNPGVNRNAAPQRNTGPVRTHD